MAQMVYNGVYFDMVDTDGITRQAIYSDDGLTYLYTYWLFDIIAIINPEAMSYNASGNQQAEQDPIVTDIAIRAKVMSPRGTLVYRVGNMNLLYTPVSGYSTDAANGPTPLDFSILEVQGMTGLLVRYKIEARVNECKSLALGSTTVPPAILSQRWETRMKIDQDYFSTRVVTGTAVFRSDALLSLGTNPDAYRGQLFHPVPPNMQRKDIEVVAESDGVTLRYSFADVEQAENLGTGSVATRVEAIQTGMLHVPTFAEKAVGIQNFSGLYSFAEAAGLNLLQQAYQQLGLFFGLPDIAPAVLAKIASGLAPVLTQHIVVRAWGNRNALRGSLRQICIGVAVSKVGTLANFYATTMICTEDLMQKYAQFEITQKYWNAQELGALAQPPQIINGVNFGPFQNGARQLLGVNILPVGAQQVLQYFTDSETLSMAAPAGGGIASTVAGPFVVGNPAPPVGQGTRGTSLVSIVAEALQAPCAVPAAPTSSNYVPANFR